MFEHAQSVVFFRWLALSAYYAHTKDSHPRPFAFATKNKILLLPKKYLVLVLYKT